MSARGWEYTGSPPEVSKFVAIGAPHTSNWDFILFLAVVSHFRLPARVIGKSSLVRWPFGNLMRRLGIIPVKRDSGQGMVEQMAEEFAAHEEMALVVAPEGTRGRSEYWRSGFYRIALAAEVPIVLTYLDYTNKRAGIGPLIEPSGDLVADMDRIRSFYGQIEGKHPLNQGPIRVREEP